MSDQDNEDNNVVNIADRRKQLQKNTASDREVYEDEADIFWAQLSQQEKELAFFAVISRIYFAEVERNATYRGVLYDTFGFDGSYYKRGMDCGFFTLHNLIVESLDPDDYDE